MSYSNAYNAAAESRPRSRKRHLLLLGVLLVGSIVVGATVLFVVTLRSFVEDVGKADPIPGITIVVDTGSALDASGMEHAARAFLNRRLREAGFDQPGLDPLHIYVSFISTGTAEYTSGARKVPVDIVRLELAFYDAKGTHLKTIELDSEPQETERVGSAAELNKAAYGRAVDQIREMDLPQPTGGFYEVAASLKGPIK